MQVVLLQLEILEGLQCSWIQNDIHPEFLFIGKVIFGNWDVI